MTLVTLSEVLRPAYEQGYAVGGLVTLGWEDMRAYVAAAEAENAPVILQAGPSCREHTPFRAALTFGRRMEMIMTVSVTHS